MSTGAQIVLEAKINRGTVRLSKSRVALFQDENPVVLKPYDLPSRYNPVPLLVFFARCKLHFLQRRDGPFQVRSEGQKWVVQLYDLINNCGKRETCWLEKVFGSPRAAPNVCSIHRVVAAFKDGREHVVALAATAPNPDQIQLSLEGRPAESETELRQFLQRLGGEETAASPESMDHDWTSSPTLSGLNVQASTNADGLPEHLKGKVSLRFPKFNFAHNEIEQECFRALGATHRLDIKWLDAGMEYGAPILPDLLRTLVDSVSECDIAISIAMLDPGWKHLGYLHPDWPDEVRKSYDKLSALAALYREHRGLGKRKVSIVVHGYEYVPNWHGLAINDSQFYLGICSWKQAVPGSSRKVLAAAENPYVVLSAERGGFEAWLTAAFRGWFEFAFNWSARTAAKKRVGARNPRPLATKGRH